MYVSYFFVNDTLYAPSVKVCEISSLEKVDSIPKNVGIVRIDALHCVLQAFKAPAHYKQLKLKSFTTTKNMCKKTC